MTAFTLPNHPIGAPARELRLSEKERKLLISIRVLQQTQKTAILIVTPEGEIQIYRGERAGLIPAP